MHRSPPSTVARPILVALAATLVAVACLPDEDKDERESRDSGWGFSTSAGSDDGRGDFGPEDVELVLSRQGLTLKLLDDARALTFGMAQTGGCTDHCWTAESCGITPDGTAICHDVPSTGLSLVPVSTADQVQPSSSTRVRPDLTGQLTFVLDDGTSCWTWGHDPSYYADQLQCTVW